MSTSDSIQNATQIARLLDGILAGLPALLQLLADERSRSGLTTEQIAERAGVKLDDERLRLIADLARLGGQASPEVAG